MRDKITFRGCVYDVNTYEIDSYGELILNCSYRSGPIGTTSTITDFGATTVSGTSSNYIYHGYYFGLGNVCFGSKKREKNYNIKKIQINPKKNATTVIFEDGHVEVVKKSPGDPEADLYSVVAYAVAKYVYGSNSAFKREIRDCIFESLEVK